jgi:hypothetical protein
VSRGAAAATLAVVTGMKERRLLGLRWRVPEWRTMDRAAGFRAFSAGFLAFPHRMIVVAPDFSNFESRYHQAFVYVPLSDFTPAKSKAAEREFLRRCIDRIRGERAERGEKAEVLCLDGKFVGDLKAGVGIGWSAPFDVVEHSGKVVSKQTCLDWILPGLRRGIGAEEGGVYTPYAGEGIFHLVSM